MPPTAVLAPRLLPVVMLVLFCICMSAIYTSLHLPIRHALLAGAAYLRAAVIVYRAGAIHLHLWFVLLHLGGWVLLGQPGCYHSL
jgi:hypothetical protein